MIRLLTQIVLIFSFPIIMMAKNPFLSSQRGAFGTFPFNELKTEHYEPAFKKAIEIHSEEIKRITDNPETPTFENTIEALDASGAMLSEVANIFFNLNSAESSDEMMEIAQRVSPLLSKHQNNISLNEALFKRIKAIYDQRESLGLTTEQAQLLKKTYLSFVNNGANLNEKEKELYRNLSEKLDQLTLNFGQNVLIETNKFELLIDNEDDLKGLPEDFKAAAKARAKAKGKEGWLIDLSAPSYIAFMKYADNRDLREKLYKAYGSRAFHNDANGNKDIVKEIVNTRIEIANLLGHPDYATYVLQEKMAKTPERVNKLLNDLLEAYAPTAKEEVKEVEAFARKSEGNAFRLMPWDWSYYSEKLKSDKFNIDDNILKPYFELESVKKGVFGLATSLYGITFTKSDSIQTYHPDVEAYEVRDANGDFLSVLYVDFHPRAGKRPGAWMTEFKAQSRKDGKRVAPQISIVMNFTPATGNTPSLLTFDEVETLLHEFGHALHGMLSDVNYESLAGTSVYQDFVELPSQIMENWATEKDFLDRFAVHYRTGEKIDPKLIQQIIDASNFNAGYACLRQLSFGNLDMAWHSLQKPFTGDIDTFEQKAMSSTQLLPVVDSTCMSSSFSHIFAGGYAAGYYGYKWAEVLDADAFSVFKKHGIFDKATAESFRKNILSKGGSDDPMTLYIRFKGSEPTIDALLERNGIKRKE
ncbi:MAG: M3 family metallopeptidase [Bacteroidales bacterium]|nr:M3 family metallopeptidase [Bacteroidales bacterium]